MTVDQYIIQFDSDAKDRLIVLRDMVHQMVPEADESISYGLIAYKLRGKPLVYFGGFASHIGLYATPNGHEAFTADFADYKQGKGSVQFPFDRPLPTALIKRVIKHRVHQLS